MQLFSVGVYVQRAKAKSEFASQSSKGRLHFSTVREVHQKEPQRGG